MKSRKVEKLKSLKLCIFASLHLCISLFFIFCILHFASPVFAQQKVIEAGISIDKVPKELYGTWRVSSKLISSNNPEIFKENNVDLWNLSRADNVITLDNPFSGAHASIMFDEINGNYVKFRKIGNYDNKKLTDTVELNLGKETFTGTNNLKLDTISEIDGHVVKSERATYTLKGSKISGESIK